MLARKTIEALLGILHTNAPVELEPWQLLPHDSLSERKRYRHQPRSIRIPNMRLPVPGKVVGPSFSAAEVPEVIEAVLDTYRRERQSAGGKAETFIATLRRVGLDPFKAAANAARFTEKQEA